jgi:hypothetical protein
MRHSVWRPAKRIASSLSLANARRADSNEFLFAMSVILIHTSGEGKVCPCVAIKGIPISKTGALSLHIGFSKITLFPG